MTVSLRSDVELWPQFINAVREIVGDWSEEQIANVASKVVSESPDKLLEDIALVFAWCRAAIKSTDDEALGTVELWQVKDLPISIRVDDDGRISHALDLDAADIEIRE